MSPIYFSSQWDFRKWLEDNHSNEKEILVGFYKVHSGIPSMTWAESVRQALCFGWIDGVRKSIDDERYSIRFTPRRADSIWSEINIKYVESLIHEGLMTEYGKIAFNKRSEKKSGIYSHEKKDIKLEEAYLKMFMDNSEAWQYFENTPKYYQKQIIHWINSAKMDETKLRILSTRNIH